MRSDVEFACDVYGNPPPSVAWLKNGETIISSNYFQVSDGGRRLNILGLVPRDQGMYQCTAENEVGSIQASARLTIRQAAGACCCVTNPLPVYCFGCVLSCGIIVPFISVLLGVLTFP